MSDLIERLRELSRDMAHIRLQEDNAGSMDVLMAADQLEAQQAEIARLRDIVVSAYHEGFCDALDEAPCCNVTSLEVLWPKSLSCAALEQNP